MIPPRKSREMKAFWGAFADNSRVGIKTRCPKTVLSAGSAYLTHGVGSDHERRLCTLDVRGRAVGRKRWVAPGVLSAWRCAGYLPRGGEYSTRPARICRTVDEPRAGGCLWSFATGTYFGVCSRFPPPQGSSTVCGVGDRRRV